MNPRTTGILFLLLAALGAFVWFYEIQGEAGRQDAKEAAKRLFPGIEAEAVEQVELTTSDGQRVRLERRASDWHLTAPREALADGFAADAIAAALAQLGSEAVFESPQPLAVYGLEDEGRDLRFQAGGVSQVLRLGKAAPVGGNRYAWVGGGTRVYTVAGAAVNALGKSLDELREKRILRFDAGGARRVTVSWQGGHVVLARGDDKSWKLEEPMVGPADETTVEGLLNDLSFLRASGFVDAPDPEQEKALAAPELEVELMVTSVEKGEELRRLTLAIGAREGGEGDRLARTDGPGLFRIASERLQDFPREVGSYRFRELARFEPEQAERLEIVFQPTGGAAAVTITALRGDEGWSSTPEAIDERRLEALIDELSRLRASRILADAMGESELQQVGLAPPNARFTVSGKTGSLAELDLGIVRGSDGVIARSGSGGAVYLLAPSTADVLPVSLEALRSRFLANPEPKPEPAEAAEEPAPAPR
ncbi:MAG: DUF4340 domain-containing protein [Candidatus Limnocylindria bacterium]